MKRKRRKQLSVNNNSISAYKNLITVTASKYRGAFEASDLNALALEGLLLAFQTWKKAYWNFDAYVVYVVAETLKAAKKQYCYYHVSLDKPFAGGTGCLKNYLRAHSEPPIENVYYSGLCSRLSIAERNILNNYRDGLTDHEIMDSLKLSASELERTKHLIGNIWKAYDPSLNV